VDLRTPRGSNLARTLFASSWFYGSRGLLFVWALLLTHAFGISDYGQFAMAYAIGATIGTPIDSYFTVRTPRVTDAEFDGERSTRVLIGLGLIVLGWLLWPFTFIGGFAVGKAGIDVCFQASRSRLVRSGHPDLAQRADAFRQIVGVGLGAAYLFFYPGATLPVAALVYLAGSATPILIGIGHMVEHAPLRPEFTRRSATIVGESLGGVIYGQAGVILLGLLDSHASAGYYSFGLTSVQALTSLGLSFAATFHESLRKAGGAVEAGPPLRTAVILSGLCGVLMEAVAIGLWIADAAPDLCLVFALLGVVAVTRNLGTIATVVLLMQHRDTFRLNVTLICLVLKLALVVSLARFGGPGAAAAFLVADMVMASVYLKVAYGLSMKSKTAGADG
jgi:O-antigen/teichoic acid export membrane protein